MSAHLGVHVAFLKLKTYNGPLSLYILYIEAMGSGGTQLKYFFKPAISGKRCATQPLV